MTLFNISLFFLKEDIESMYIFDPGKLPYIKRFILSVGFILGLLVVGFDRGLTFDRQMPRSFERAEFERIHSGMKLNEIEAILGRGIKTEETSNFKKYVWKNLDGSQIFVEFDSNNFARHSVQHGL